MKNQEIEENNNYRQGRSKRQYERNETIVTWTTGCIVILVSLLIIYNFIN